MSDNSETKATVKRMDVTVYRVGRDRLVLVGIPPDSDTVPEGHHNCDYMGCGSVGPHVVGRAVLLRADGDGDWDRRTAMARLLTEERDI